MELQMWLKESPIYDEIQRNWVNLFEWHDI